MTVLVRMWIMQLLFTTLTNYNFKKVYLRYFSSFSTITILPPLYYVYISLYPPSMSIMSLSLYLCHYISVTISLSLISLSLLCHLFLCLFSVSSLSNSLCLSFPYFHDSSTRKTANNTWNTSLHYIRWISR